MIWRLVLPLFLLTATLLQAAPQTFEASNVKYLYKVSIDQRKGQISGVFKRSEYGVNGRKYSFRGAALPARPGEKRFAIKFSGGDIKKMGEPYASPTGMNQIVWRMVATRKGPRLYIPMTWKSGNHKPAWKTVEVEFDPS